MRLLPAFLATLAVAIPTLHPAAASAAESYDNCAGTVASLPAVIATQGVWCLKKDLATVSASGTAITISAPNVTLDCNGFKIGGLGAGPGTTAIGIDASGTSNVTVRGCNIRGFATGVYADFSGGGGHVVEDNRFEGNTVYAIQLQGDGSLIRRNQILDTGGSTNSNALMGAIRAFGNMDVLDNSIRGVDAGTQDPVNVYGIYLTNADAGAIAGNRISGLSHIGAGAALGIRVNSGTGVIIRGNDISGNGALYGIYCAAVGTGNVARDNTIHDTDTPLTGCDNGGGNVVSP